jgi:hypothetical protein
MSKEENRMKLLVASEEYIESLLKEAQLEMEEVQKLQEAQSKSKEKKFYIVDHITVKGTSGKEYWTITDWEPYQNKGAIKGTCNEYGFTDKMPDGYEKHDKLDVVLGWSIRNAQLWKGEQSTFDGCIAGIVKLFPNLCKQTKKKADKKIETLVPMDKLAEQPKNELVKA